MTKSKFYKIPFFGMLFLSIVLRVQSAEQVAIETSPGKVNNLCAWVENSRPLNMVKNHPIATVTALSLVTSAAYLTSWLYQTVESPQNEGSTSLVQYPSEVSTMYNFDMVSTALQNLSTFVVQYPSGLSTSNGLNNVLQLSPDSELGRMVINYLWEQGYQGDFSNFHLVRFKSLGLDSTSNYSFGNYVLANCSRFCVDSFTEMSGFLCQQVSDHVFASRLSRILSIDQLQFIIPSGVYETPYLAFHFPNASYLDLIGHCKSFLKYIY